MADCKPDRGVGDEGVLRVGAHERSSSESPQDEATALPPPDAPATASAPLPPDTRAHRDAQGASAARTTRAPGGWGRLALSACVLPVALAAIGFVAMLALQAYGASGTPGGRLDTAYYERLSETARQLSTQPTSRLYGTYLHQAGSDWPALSTEQQGAVAAAWIRYTRNPASFQRLVPEQKRYVFDAFASYLQALAAEGDAQATRDLSVLQATR